MVNGKSEQIKQIEMQEKTIQKKLLLYTQMQKQQKKAMEFKHLLSSEAEVEKLVASMSRCFADAQHTDINTLAAANANPNTAFGISSLIGRSNEKLLQIQ